MTDQKPQTMRDALIDALCALMEKDDGIFFVTADFGAPALDRLRERFTDRFVNVGIAEQNLINVSVGLAMEGYAVYAYAIAPFITMRAYEQVRVNLAITSQLRPLNVNLIGVGAGISYDMSGPTHHCIEDIAIMRLLPNFTVHSPGDWGVAAALAPVTRAINGPKYLRFDGKPAKLLDAAPVNIAQGFRTLVAGNTVCIAATGYMAHVAVEAAARIPGAGVLDVFTLKPFNAAGVAETLSKYRAVITLEEGLLGGGLDGLVARALSTHGCNIPHKAMGFNDTYVFGQGTRAALHKKCGIDADSVARVAADLLPRR